MLSRVRRAYVNKAVDAKSKQRVKRSKKAGNGKRQKPKDLAGRADEGHDAAVPLCGAAAGANSRYLANAALFASGGLGAQRQLRQLRRLMQQPPGAAIGLYDKAPGGDC